MDLSYAHSAKVVDEDIDGSHMSDILNDDLLVRKDGLFDCMCVIVTYLSLSPIIGSWPKNFDSILGGEGASIIC